jgi:hypothetical protein
MTNKIYRYVLFLDFHSQICEQLLSTSIDEQGLAASQRNGDRHRLGERYPGCGRLAIEMRRLKREFPALPAELMAIKARARRLVAHPHDVWLDPRRRRRSAVLGIATMLETLVQLHTDLADDGSVFPAAGLTDGFAILSWRCTPPRRVQSPVVGRPRTFIRESW